MRRPPDSVVFVARVHWMMAAAVAAFFLGLHFLLRRSSIVELSPRGYAVILGLVLLYALTGALVWWGQPGGRFLGHVCSILYFARPPLGSKMAALMRSDEFKTHFRRPPAAK